jgi:hypothetical protein
VCTVCPWSFLLVLISVHWSVPRRNLPGAELHQQGVGRVGAGCGLRRPCVGLPSVRPRSQVHDGHGMHQWQVPVGCVHRPQRGHDPQPHPLDRLIALPIWRRHLWRPVRPLSRWQLLHRLDGLHEWIPLHLERVRCDVQRPVRRVWLPPLPSRPGRSFRTGVRDGGARPSHEAMYPACPLLQRCARRASR